MRESVDKSSLGSRKRSASAGSGQCVPWMAFWCTIFGGSFSALPLAAMAAESDGRRGAKKKKKQTSRNCGAACGRAALAGGRLRREGVPLCAAAAGWWRRVGAGWRLRRGARRKVHSNKSSVFDLGCQPSCGAPSTWVLSSPSFPERRVISGVDATTLYLNLVCKQILRTARHANAHQAVPAVCTRAATNENVHGVQMHLHRQDLGSYLARQI